jgi:hypothetical protein
MTRGGSAVLAVLLTPGLARACASCISTPFGDQTYTWPYLGLILLPFALMAAVVGVLAYHTGYGPRRLQRWLAARFFTAPDDPEILKETT